MTAKLFDTPFGQGKANFSGNSLHNVMLPTQNVAGQEFYISLLGMAGLEGADDINHASHLIANACNGFSPYVMRIAEYHKEAQARLKEMGWPDDLRFTRAWFQFQASTPGHAKSFTHEERQVELMYSVEDSFLVFWVGNKGTLTAKFTKYTIKTAIEKTRKIQARSAMPILEHEVFGNFMPDTLVKLRRKKFENRFIGFDLYLADKDIDQFALTQLDDFVDLRENLEDIVPELKKHLSCLRIDWATDWLCPLNMPQAKAFHAQFPMAASAKEVPRDLFEKSLWLSRICLNPFGSGKMVHPIATWDFHVLPKEKDNTIFVARTHPDGTLIDVTTES